MEDRRDRGITDEQALIAVSTCRVDRLPYVLDILRRSGYEFSNDAIQLARTTQSNKIQRVAKRRKVAKKAWLETDDEAVELLREAYFLGMSITDINRRTGINRTVMYEYLKGTRKVPEHCRETLISNLNDLIEKAKEESA